MPLTSQFPVLLPLVSGSVRPIPRLMPTMAMVACTEVMVDTVLAMATVVTATARGLPIPRPTLTTATEAMGATVLAMEAMAMAVLATAMARGRPLRRRRLPLSLLAGPALATTPRLALSSRRVTRSARPIPRPMPTTATVASMEVMADTVWATAMVATGTESKPMVPIPNYARVRYQN